MAFWSNPARVGKSYIPTRVLTIVLKSIDIENYRSIKSLSLELKGFNCLVGPNNSGKSNFLDIFQFIFDLINDELDGAIRKRGRDSIRFQGSGHTEPIIISLTFDSSDESIRCIKYVIGFHPEGQIERESLHKETNAGESISLISRNNQHVVKYVDHEGQQSGVTMSAGSAGITHVFQQGAYVSADLREAIIFLANMHVYRFNPYHLKAEGEVEITSHLISDGSNFASHLHHIQTSDRESFNSIEHELINNFESIKELNTPISKKHRGRTHIGIKEKWFPDNFHSSTVSDGLIGFLAHLTVLYGPNTPALTCFEEPENYIHPRLMERLVDMLKKSSLGSQIFISTHSTSLLNRLGVKDILIVSRIAGETRISPVESDEALANSLEGWAIGDALASGELILDD